MMNYLSWSHWLTRPMSAAVLATLTPAQRLERTRAQKRLSAARRRPTRTFSIPDVQPPPRSPHRDYLSLEDPTRDILRP
jgi:hypothetical protein